MTGPEALGVRRCRGCGRLLHARDACTPCDTAIVHVVTTLGSTPDMPGQRVRAELAGGGPGFGDIPMWRYDPWAGVPEDVVARATKAYSDRIDQETV